MTLLTLRDADRRLFTKLYASADDLKMAREWAEHIQKRKLFRNPWSRGKVYLRQAAYVTALVVAYGRVFAVGRGGFKLPKRLIPYETEEWDLHRRLLELRNKVHAHSDLDKWKVKPWSLEGFSTVIVGKPTHLIDEADITLFLSMTERLLLKIFERSDEILAPYLTARSSTPKDPVEIAMEATRQLEVGEMLTIRIAPEA